MNIVWRVQQSIRGPDSKIELPCGQCIGCRLERSRQWAVRIMHESQLHLENTFITLTYSTENLPPRHSLQLSDFQKFMKRLRKHCAPRRIRFFHCGEYGESCKTCSLGRPTCQCPKFTPGIGRPHFHAILFNYAFEDQKHFKNSPQGSKIYTSETLTKIWGLGYASTGAVTFESAAYVARYIMKKINGDLADDHYRGRKPEYTTMSRRKGIGYEWYKKFKSDVFPADEVIMRGIPMKPPKFYDNILDLENPKLLKVLKDARIKAAKKRIKNALPKNPKRLTIHPLTVAEACKKAQINSLTRPLE